jgi:glycosyltransferase involved in cell wall biosynthesis
LGAIVRSVLVVIPAYNEVDTVGDVVRALPDHIDEVKVSALVVDDGSTDGTAEAAAAAGAEVFRLPVNQGQGRALREGYRIAGERGADVIATVDADGQFDLADLPALIAPIRDGEADFVNGSRRLGRPPATHDHVRRLGLVLFAAWVTALTRVRITDPANGLRAFRTEVVAAVPLRQPQYQTSELLIGAIRRGFRVREIPVTVLPRVAGQSKKGGNLSYGWGFAKAVVTTWWVSRPGRRRPPP